jgi:deoxyribodipyrimidine photo-lyase
MGPVSIWWIRRDLRLADNLALAAAQAAGRQVVPAFVLDPRLLQGKKFDPRGEDMRRGILELAHVPLRHLHEPWEMPESGQAEVGMRTGLDNPSPIVEHGTARRDGLAAYAEARRSPPARPARAADGRR